MAFDELYDFVIEKLKTNLPETVSYHNFEHTQNVTRRAMELSQKEGLSTEQTFLLKTAALFHDTGFLINQKGEGHEKRSSDYAKEILPQHGYTDSQIEEITEMILATKLPQNPKNLLQEILCDADLYYLGTNKYFPLSEKLYAEFQHDNRNVNSDNWHQIQNDFLQNHTFFTKTAQANLNETKDKNIKKILDEMKLKKRSSKINKYKENANEYLLIILGVIIAAGALKGLLVPNHFFDGGITGFSLLIHELYHVNLGILIVVFNIPLIVIGYFTVSKSFAIKTSVAVLLLGIILTFMPEFHVTEERILASIFGGVFLGIGVGLNMRAGAALDGIEVLALYTLKRTSFTITEIIMGLNLIIFIIAASKFGIQTALYSSLTYFAATRTIDYVVEGLQAFTGVTIISSESETIKFEIVNSLKRGITIYKGERGFLPESFKVSTESDIIFTVITRFELRKLNNLVHDIDPKAFVFASTIKEASGGILNRKQHH